MQKSKPISRMTLSTATVVTSLEFVVVLLVLGTIYMGWQITSPTNSYTNVTASVDQKFADLQKQQQQVTTLPELKLNRVNERKGPTITADPNAGGKANPFK